MDTRRPVETELLGKAGAAGLEMLERGSDRGGDVALPAWIVKQAPVRAIWRPSWAQHRCRFGRPSPTSKI